MIDNHWEADEIAAYPYLECGAWGHGWSEDDPPAGVTTIFDSESMILHCLRCDGWRLDQMRRESWSLIARRYIMPADYHFVKGQRPSRRDFAFALIAKRKTRKRRGNGGTRNPHQDQPQ